MIWISYLAQKEGMDAHLRKYNIISLPRVAGELQEQHGCGAQHGADGTAAVAAPRGSGNFWM